MGTVESSRMTVPVGVLAEIPYSSQNPLLPADKFAKHCAERLRSVSHWTLGDRLKAAASTGYLRPLVVYENHLLYSPFQAWQVLHARWDDDASSKYLLSFEPVLRLLVIVQDYYLPETRGNGRVAEWRDYGGIAVLDGTWFLKTMTYLTSTLRRFRQEAIESGKLRPLEALSDCGISAEDLKKWQRNIHMDASGIDPLRDWRDLVGSISYSRRMKLRFEALLATELYALVDVLRQVGIDAGWSAETPEYADPTDLAPRDEKTEIPAWRVRKYGGTLWNPHETLEFICNDYDINPKPRGIVFAEGEEAKALSLLFRAEGFDPELLGIEFRSIAGSGNFQLGNWQPFIEYMHEKQVLIYFVVDREGDVERQAKRLLDRERVFAADGLKKVIPAADRITVWNKSFEEDNFTDSELARAFEELGVTLTSEEVTDVRSKPAIAGLVERLIRRTGVELSKARLAEVLITNLIEWRRLNPDAPLRPVEKFVEEAGGMISLNHQPTSVDSVKRNRATGLLG